MPIRVVLADDHPIVLMALRQLLESDPGFEVLGSYDDGTATLEAVRESRPDVLILDLRMTPKSGLDVLQELKKSGPRTRVVVLTAAVDESEVLDAIRLGVQGVVLKEMAPHLLLHAVRKVHEGGRWVETELAGRAMEEMLQREAAIAHLSPILTAREIEVARLAAAGLRNAEVAERLFISEGTVKLHLHNVYSKLKVGSRFELTRYAREIGLV
jgi:two-component system, NarL family, nitrate/nitrite response regulator NarL